MKVLLDEDLPVQLAASLRSDHETAHVAQIGWKGKSNGALLRDAVAAGFDVLVTGDAHIRWQQDLREFDIAVIELRPRRIVLQDLQALVPELLEAIATAPRRAAVVIPGTEGREGRGVRPL